MKKLYGNLKMSWLTIILFALVAGVYTGVVMMIDILDETSFQDIGISYEWWVIFAVIVVVNCDKSVEAMFKCFLFFLISQPIVYAVQILFGQLAANLAWIYYKTTWLPATVLTLPGGFIAYHCKKQNMLGAVILGLGNTIQAFMGVSYFYRAFNSFPHHILSGIICLASIFIMSFCIQKEKKYRLVSILLAFMLAAVVSVYMVINGMSFG